MLLKLSNGHGAEAVRKACGRGDVFFARFNYFLTVQNSAETMARTLAYYRVEGTFVVNDVMHDLDLMQVLSPVLAPPSQAQS